MGQHEDKLGILKKYYKKIETSYGFDIKGEIKSSKIDNALKKFASGLDRTTIIGFYDTTIFGNGKSGYIFTDTKVYYLETLEKPKKIWYEDIQNVEIIKKGKKNCDDELKFEMKDGSTVVWTSCFLNKQPLYEFFKELLKYECNEEKRKNANITYDSRTNIGAAAGGIGIGNYQQVNKLYDEEKVHARQGHGFAAERANNLYDRMTGHDAKIVGDDNVKNGADRIVDGKFIQSKYCQTGKGCINECFDKEGNFRYLQDGKPMQIVILSSFDIIDIFRGRISGKQLFKNLTNTTTTVIGGTGGWIGGAAVGSAILPGVGTIVGGLIGSVLAGSAAGKVTDAVFQNLDEFKENDVDEMVKLIQDEFEKLAYDYLLNQKEAEKIVDKLGEKLSGNVLKDIYASTDRKSDIKNILVPLIEAEVEKREHIKPVTEEQMTQGLKEVLEEIADYMEVNEIELA